MCLIPLILSFSQTSLDSIITREVKSPAFTNAGLMDHIVELIIREDEVSNDCTILLYVSLIPPQAFCLVDHDSFRLLLRFCRPSLSERDIPHRQTLRAEILRRAGIVEGRVRETLKNVPSKISFTFDAWTSAPGDPYLLLTAHYIAAPVDRPNEWELKTDQLLFQEIQGRHTGKNMGDILSRALDRYDLRGKVRSFHNSLLFLLIPTTGWVVYQRWCGR